MFRSPCRDPLRGPCDASPSGLQQAYVTACLGSGGHLSGCNYRGLLPSAELRKLPRTKPSRRFMPDRWDDAMTTRESAIPWRSGRALCPSRRQDPEQQTVDSGNLLLGSLPLSVPDPAQNSHCNVRFTSHECSRVSVFMFAQLVHVTCGNGLSSSGVSSTVQMLKFHVNALGWSDLCS